MVIFVVSSQFHYQGHSFQKPQSAIKPSINPAIQRIHRCWSKRDTNTDTRFMGSVSNTWKVSVSRTIASTHHGFGVKPNIFFRIYPSLKNTTSLTHQPQKISHMFLEFQPNKKRPLLVTSLLLDWATNIGYVTSWSSRISIQNSPTWGPPAHCNFSSSNRTTCATSCFLVVNRSSQKNTPTTGWTPNKEESTVFFVDLSKDAEDNKLLAMSHLWQIHV